MQQQHLPRALLLSYQLLARRCTQEIGRLRSRRTFIGGLGERVGARREQHLADLAGFGKANGEQPQARHTLLIKQFLRGRVGFANLRGRYITWLDMVTHRRLLDQVGMLSSLAWYAASRDHDILEYGRARSDNFQPCDLKTPCSSPRLIARPKARPSETPS